MPSSSSCGTSREVLDVVPARVAGGHAQHLVVAARLVDHLEHGHRPGLARCTPGNTDSRQQHHRVQRVAVLAEGVLDEAVVGRIAHRRVEVAVQPDPAGVVVDLVLVARPFGISMMTSNSTVAAPSPAAVRVARRRRRLTLTRSDTLRYRVVGHTARASSQENHASHSVATLHPRGGRRGGRCAGRGRRRGGGRRSPRAATPATRSVPAARPPATANPRVVPVADSAR